MFLYEAPSEAQRPSESRFHICSGTREADGAQRTGLIMGLRFSNAASICSERKRSHTRAGGGQETFGAARSSEVVYVSVI